MHASCMSCWHSSHVQTVIALGRAARSALGRAARSALGRAANKRLHVASHGHVSEGNDMGTRIRAR